MSSLEWSIKKKSFNDKTEKKEGYFFLHVYFPKVRSFCVCIIM